MQASYPLDPLLCIAFFEVVVDQRYGLLQHAAQFPADQQILLGNYVGTGPGNHLDYPQLLEVQIDELFVEQVEAYCALIIGLQGKLLAFDNQSQVLVDPGQRLIAFPAADRLILRVIFSDLLQLLFGYPNVALWRAQHPGLACINAQRVAEQGGFHPGGGRDGLRLGAATAEQQTGAQPQRPGCKGTLHTRCIHERVMRWIRNSSMSAVATLEAS